MFEQYLVIISCADSLIIREFRSLSDAQDYAVGIGADYGIFCLVNSNG